MTGRLLPRMASVMLSMGAIGAHGEVTVFGPGDATPNTLGQSDRDGLTTPTCASCSFGIDGANELGNGLRAIYRYEWGTDESKGVGHDRWLGVGGSFGEVKVGTLSERHKSTGVIPDPMYQPSSLNVTGLPSVSAGYKAKTGDNVGADDRLGLSYENAGVLIFADYLPGRTGGEDTAYNVGAKLSTDDFGVFGQYRIDSGVSDHDGADTTTDNTNLWFFGGSLSLGDTSIYAGYGKADSPVNAAAAPGYDIWEVVGVQSVGKSTSIYAGYSGTSCADSNPDACKEAGPDGFEDDKFSLGIRHNF